MASLQHVLINILHFDIHSEPKPSALLGLSDMNASVDNRILCIVRFAHLASRELDGTQEACCRNVIQRTQSEDKVKVIRHGIPTSITHSEQLFWVLSFTSPSELLGHCKLQLKTIRFNGSVAAQSFGSGMGGVLSFRYTLSNATEEKTRWQLEAPQRTLWSFRVIIVLLAV